MNRAASLIALVGGLCAPAAAAPRHSQSLRSARACRGRQPQRCVAATRELAPRHIANSSQHAESSKTTQP